MDAVQVWLNAGILVGTLAAAAVAWWQAIVARRDRRAADDAARRAIAAQEATASHLGRSADAQERIADATRKFAWDRPKPLGGNAWTIRNTSGKRIEVEAIEVDPPAASALLRVENDLPCIVESGGLLHFSAEARWTIRVRAFTLHWNFTDGDGAPHTSERTLPITQ